MTSRAFNGETPIGEIVDYIDTIRRRPSLRDTLVGMLAEHARIYAGRPGNEVELLRAYVLSSFRFTGLPHAAVPFIQEELESGRHPNTVAAAAMALQGDMQSGKLEKSDRTIRLLLAAMDRMMSADDVVDFESTLERRDDNSPATAVIALLRALAECCDSSIVHTTMMALLVDRAADLSEDVRAEIQALLRTLSSATRKTSVTEMASCCCESSSMADIVPVPQDFAAKGHFSTATSAAIAGIELQDQEGAITTFGDFVAGRLTILTFFYTRCTNPEKCSLTISKLGQLQHRFIALGWADAINVAAITYDPAFDLPQRLKGYGNDRGMKFDRHNRLLRTTGAFDPLQRHFELGVGFGPVTVNRHRIDLLILDATGNVVERFTRELWSESDVVAALKSHIRPVGTQCAEGLSEHSQSVS